MFKYLAMFHKNENTEETQEQYGEHVEFPHTIFCNFPGLFRWVLVPISFCMDAFVDPHEEFFSNF